MKAPRVRADTEYRRKQRSAEKVRRTSRNAVGLCHRCKDPLDREGSVCSACAFAHALMRRELRRKRREELLPRTVAEIRAGLSADLGRLSYSTVEAAEMDVRALLQVLVDG